MPVDLESELRNALKTRGDAITLTTLRRSAPTATSRRRRHVNAVWLSAAAMVAVLVSVVALVANASQGGSSGGAGGGGSDQLQRTLHFAIDLPEGDKITQVDSAADGTQDVAITTANRAIVRLTVDPPGGVRRRFRNDAQPTTVAGRLGFIGATWTDSQYDSNNADLTSDLSWKYNGVAYAVLNPEYPPAAVSVLMDLGRRIDFSKQTVIRVAAAIASLPTGTHPAEVLSTYLAQSTTDYPWDSTIILSLDSSTRDAIRVEVCKCGSSSSERSDAQTRIINGRTAYIYANGSGGADVEIDQGGGVVLHVTSSHSDGGKWTGTMSQLLEVAAGVSVTAWPNVPTKWYDAATAIPSE